ncbi:MAG: PLP-dependent aminotransferase family protein [Actinomycetota bacterium]|nr:PLP-dependent aminotransferase family protein [Actinomycetota bacterium]
MPLNAAELLVTLGESTRAPLRVRLGDALRDTIRSGQLAPGTTLPSTRILAQDLGVSRGVVVDAYAQLAAEGYVHGRAGAATTVSYTPAAALPARWHEEQPAPRPAPELDLRPGWPDLSAFPRRAWAATTRDVLRNLPDSGLGYGEPWGVWELRRQLAGYLARVRGAMTAPDGVVVVGGVTQGLTLLCRVLRGDGEDRLAVEDPSNAIQRQLLGRLGMRLVDVPVDASGVRVDLLAATGTRAVLCTPAHQYPSGVVLSPARREELLRWAREVGGLVIEDDYDAEFRYERAPLSCLQGMDPQHVALLGSVSKTLAPALRIGWVVTPPVLLSALRGIKRDDDFGSNAIEQHVLARLLESGAYDRHLRGLRRRYRQRRDAFVDALARRLPEWRVLESAGGLNLTIALPPELPERQLVAAAAGLGLAVLGLQEMSGHQAPGPGIVLSYARATPGMSEDAVRRLADASVAVDQVTAEQEAAVARAANLWNDLV